jgi:hypothetical protein
MFAKEIILTENTELHPQGWTSGTLPFKGGTKVILNENGEVVSGILINYAHWLLPAGHANTYIKEQTIYRGTILYRGDITPVTFSKRGHVLSGSLGDITVVKLFKDSFPYVEFALGTMLIFREDGSVESGTLGEDTYLKTAATGKFEKYKGRTEVTFNEKGEVTSGKLAQ